MYTCSFVENFGNQYRIRDLLILMKILKMSKSLLFQGIGMRKGYP